MAKNYDITPSERDGWNVTAEGGQRASSHHDRKDDAIAAARRYAANAGGGEVRVLDDAGHLVQSDTVPPRDTEDRSRCGRLRWRAAAGVGCVIALALVAGVTLRIRARSRR
jgi:hypothetical protein